MTNRDTRRIFVFLILCCYTCACRMPRSDCPLHSIGLRPLGGYDSVKLSFIRRRLGDYFHKPIVILPAINLPASFINYSKGERYSADSIIRYLSALPRADSISNIVGLTSEDIYTTVRDSLGRTKAPVS